jgi:hypothetical protein
MHHLKLAPGAENHPAGKSQPRGREDRLIPLIPPGQALRACVGGYRFEL